MDDILGTHRLARTSNPVEKLRLPDEPPERRAGQSLVGCDAADAAARRPGRSESLVAVRGDALMAPLASRDPGLLYEVVDAIGELNGLIKGDEGVGVLD
jgi:hypothetical protein